MALLGVNIDHVATVRQARRAAVPDVVAAGQAAEAGGADSITVHLREDRRHIQDRDVANLRKALRVRLNFEMAATPEMVRIARVIRPHSVCLVPEKRMELTTEGGLDVLGQLSKLKEATAKIKAKGILVSFFIDPNPVHVHAAKEAGADMVELHTGSYAEPPGAKPAKGDKPRPSAQEGGDKDARAGELAKLERAAQAARTAGLLINAGHGLDYENVGPVAKLAGINELNIGFSIVSRALFVGMEQAVREMKKAIG